MSGPVGYVIAGIDEKGADTASIQNDWDGEIHQQLDTAQESLAECHREGYPNYRIYELHALPNCSTCEGSGRVDVEGQIGAPGSGGTFTCSDCGPRIVERIES